MIYLLNYSIYKPFVGNYHLDVHSLGWNYIKSILEDVYVKGGEFVIERAVPRYNEGKYIEFKEVIGYDYFDKYSFVCDPNCGYLFGCSIYECEKYPEGAYFSLINKAVSNPNEIFVFSPYDDEWEARYVNQDINIALILFKEIYDNGKLSQNTINKWFF